MLDASVALVAEGYLTLPGMDWWGALEAAGNIGNEAPPDHVEQREKTDEEKAAENQATMASIMGALGGSTFKGPAS